MYSHLKILYWIQLQKKIITKLIARLFTNLTEFLHQSLKEIKYYKDLKHQIQKGSCHKIV